MNLEVLPFAARRQQETNSSKYVYCVRTELIRKQHTIVSIPSSICILHYGAAVCDDVAVGCRRILRPGRFSLVHCAMCMRRLRTNSALAPHNGSLSSAILDLSFVGFGLEYFLFLLVIWRKINKMSADRVLKWLGTMNRFLKKLSGEASDSSYAFLIHFVPWTV